MSFEKERILKCHHLPAWPRRRERKGRSMTQYTASEVETIFKDEVTLSLEALIRVGGQAAEHVNKNETTLAEV